tara:strand:+ start:3221 stop:4129 length:909 start_codon:yes stop_codon:yes gene_type:complete
MTEVDKNQQAQQQKISDLYATLKQEQPTAELDKRILDLAKQQVAPRESALETKAQILSVDKRSWRRWQWPLSIAASVMLVSVIFIDQTSKFMPGSVILAPQEINELMPDSAKSSVARDSNNNANLNSEAKEQPEVLGLSINDGAGDELTSTVVEDKHAQLQGELAKQAVREKQQLTEWALVEKQKRMSAAVSESQTQLVLLEIETLQQQLSIKQAQLVILQQQEGVKLRPDSLRENNIARFSLNTLKLKELKTQVSELQDTLFVQMNAYNQQVPGWQASDELLSLLSREQQQLWLNARRGSQ